MNTSSASTVATGSLYARIWRWHFFAALGVIPFVLLQATTGTLYLWHQDLERAAHREMMFVTPLETRASYNAQLATARAHHPGERLTTMVVEEDSERSTAFMFTAASRLPYPAFVDPYSGAYLGDVRPLHWLTGLTRALHGGWPIEPYGSYLLELGASWAIVMILTGLYLWWPRTANGLAGVLYPRLNNGSRVFWRDLHATVGIYFSLIVLAFLFTALPWTTFWGKNVLKPLERATHQLSPVESFFSAGHHPGAGALAGVANSNMQIDLDAVVAQARAAGARDRLEIRIQPGQSVVAVHSVSPRAADEVYLHIDGETGTLLHRITWADFPWLSKVVATGVDLHEGTFFGRASQWFNTLMAASLVWLSITGFIGWYKRRPHGGFAAPPRREVRFPKLVLASGAVLACALPMLGASIIAIATVDRVTRVLTRR